MIMIASIKNLTEFGIPRLIKNLVVTIFNNIFPAGEILILCIPYKSTTLLFSFSREHTSHEDLIIFVTQKL